MNSSCLRKAEVRPERPFRGPGGAKMGEGHFAVEKGTPRYNLSPMDLILLQC